MNELPKGWTTVALDDVTNKVSKWDPHTSSMTFTYVDIAAVDAVTKCIAHPQTLLGPEAPSRARQLISRGDILISTVRPNLNAVAFVPAQLDGATASTGFSVLRAKEELEPRYLYHWVQTRHFIGQMVRQATGQSYPAVSEKTVRRSELPLPALDEQRRIATILDKAAALRGHQEQANTALHRLKLAAFTRIFGHPSTWRSRWEMVTIKDLADSVQYGTSSKAGDVGEYKILRMGNVTIQGRIDLTDLKYIDLPKDEAEKYTTRRGDLLFNRTNSLEQVGKTGLVDTDEPLAIAGYLVRLRLRTGVSPEFVSTYLNSPYGQKIRQGMAKSAINQANINASQLKSIPIALPPQRLQQEFREIVQSLDRSRDRLASAKSLASELTTCLQSRAFRGEL